MVDKDQLEQTPEGKEVLALMAKHFSEEQFQHALTLIEQRYTEEQPIWDADLNSDSKLPFLKTTPAHRLLVFFANPSYVAKIKAELKQRAAEAAIHAAESQAGQPTATAKPKPKRKSYPKTGRTAHRPRGRKGTAAKTFKSKPRKPQRSKTSAKRAKRRTPPSKAKKSRPKKH